VRVIALPHGHETLIDEATWQTVRNLTLYRGTNGYVYYSTWENGRSVPRTLHALLMCAPPGMHTDHINGDKLDNRLANLRIVTPSVNQANRRRLNRNNRSGTRGVHQNKHGSWVAQIMVDRKARYLGSFPTREEATEARRAAELEHYGELCP
jgi:hypothetical protein